MWQPCTVYKFHAFGDSPSIQNICQHAKYKHCYVFSCNIKGKTEPLLSQLPLTSNGQGDMVRSEAWIMVVEGPNNWNFRWHATMGIFYLISSRFLLGFLAVTIGMGWSWLKIGPFRKAGICLHRYKHNAKTIISCGNAIQPWKCWLHQLVNKIQSYCVEKHRTIW